MGELYDLCQEVIRIIDSRGLDVYKTRGAINMQCGFLITLIREDDPDDPERIATLRKAAKDVLGTTL
ncbi:MAG: hypothetical protein Kow0056_12210 [Coriobacteriia bacterium]